MNKFVNFLERKIGKYSIQKLPLYMLICYAIGYLMEIINPNIVYFLSLNPYAIVHGQVWRLVTWVLIPPDSISGNFINMIFTLIMLYFYYSIGLTLERTWGTFYFNYYIFSGMVFTILGAFAMMGYSYLFKAEEMAWAESYMTAAYGQACSFLQGGNYYFLVNSMYFSTYYINMSIFLAFAATYPEMEVRLYFIIPLKVKYLAVFYAIILAYSAISEGAVGIFVCVSSLLNFVIFFLAIWRLKHRTIKNIRRQRTFRRKMNPRSDNASSQKIAKHKCAICGRTSESYPNLEFRFCSKCQGNYEFCQDHLFTHKHFTWNNNSNS